LATAAAARSSPSSPISVRRRLSAPPAGLCCQEGLDVGGELGRVLEEEAVR
jgi:hypothetical protein